MIAWAQRGSATGRARKDTQPGILDEEHLGHMTLGDRRLEREVLEIFVRQSATMLDLIFDARRPGSLPPWRPHTLIGSARGIGAWRVAQAAERLERAANARDERADRDAIAALKAASLEATAAIGAHLADPARSTAECRLNSIALTRTGALRHDPIEDRAPPAGAFPPGLPSRNARIQSLAMVKITFIDTGGTARTVEGEVGATVMETAIKHGVPGIEAECGGACACSTCHVYIEEVWREKVGEPSPMEEDMLDFAFEVRPNSRLSCQIKMREELDGLTVRTPERQA